MVRPFFNQEEETYGKGYAIQQAIVSLLVNLLCSTVQRLADYHGRPT